MFGYIKPDKNNLLVKDLATYKAVYCGLCSVIKKEISFFLPFSLSYDFVFLAMVRYALTAEKCTVKKGRCKYNPLKKCAFCTSENQTLYTARCALILTYLKLEDDIKDSDTSLFKKLIVRPVHFHLGGKVKRLVKKCPELEVLTATLKNKLGELAALEKEHSADVDKNCELFGDIMSETASFGLSGSDKIIASQIGAAIGRYIYLIDALDDSEKDSKSGAYNPLIEQYGSCEKINENINEIDIALSMFAKNAVLANNLIKDSDYSRIIENILSLGLGAEAYRIETRGKND